MIEFSGDFSEESKRYLLRDSAKSAFIVVFIVSIFFGAIITIVSAILDLWILMLFWIALLVIVATATVSPYVYRVQTLQNMMPKKVVINKDDFFIEAEWETRSMEKSISDVKKIIDTGSCYHIVFNFPKESDIFCQKDSITKGTTEDFERLFGDKIIKKTRKIENR
jgi:hypothetical protein